VEVIARLVPMADSEKYYASHGRARPEEGNAQSTVFALPRTFALSLRAHENKVCADKFGRRDTRQHH
jgi:hypothetical protein